jgi:hypothetical protein
MYEAWATMFGTNSLAITAGELQVAPGFGRHQLQIPIKVRPGSEQAYGHDFAFSGSLRVGGLTGGGGYLGSFWKTQPRKLNANSVADVYLFVDVDLNQIAQIERHRVGGFNLDIYLDIDADYGVEHTSTQIIGHPVQRERWLSILEQVKYQRTIILELRAPDPEAAPQFAKSLNFFADAQRRFLEGSNRQAVESLRQSLVSLVNQTSAEDDSVEGFVSGLKAARKDESKYEARFELVRQALKLLTDLGAHPEVDETGPEETRSAIAMVGGLLQWYSITRASI